jgi:hypothetical protein
MSNNAIVETMRAVNGISEDCHTYAHWKELGRQVKRGEKAAFMAPMWKPNMRKPEGGEQAEQTMSGFFAKTSAFFKYSQTEPIKA